MRLRRVLGTLALMLFTAFQGEAVVPDECADTTRASWVQSGTESALPSTDQHPIHACHCVHVHVATRAVTVQLAVAAAVSRTNWQFLATGTSAPPHNLFRPPLS